MAGSWFRSLMLAFALSGVFALPAAAQSSASGADPVAGQTPTSTADHSQFEALAGPFQDAQEVNQACLSCHNTGPEQLHGTIHFTWSWPPGSAGEPATADTALGGMRHLANGFLLSTPSNLDACSSCHIAGTRFDDPAMFDASGAPVAPVDCLSCHEPTGEWALANFHEDGAACSMCHDERYSGPKPRVTDLVAAAQSVGASTRASCGTCHFNADGGNGVKHGDLNADLLDPPASLDVHMAAAPEGAGFTCSTCHTTRDHVIAGSRYSGMPDEAPDWPALAGATASCQGCHSATPHEELESGLRLDRHTDRVACETCHIPSIARGETETRVLWDWSSVGTLGRDHRAMVLKDPERRITYTTEKGNLATAGNIRPTLIWSDGELTQLRPGDTLPDAPDTEPAEAELATSGAETREAPDLGTIEAAFADAPWIASYQGDAASAQSRIAPVKVMHSVVPTDAENRALAAVLFAGRGGDALWNRFDWTDAVQTGMQAAGLPFSGEVAFAQVRQMIPVSHMVAPADQATACRECHVDDGLLADLPGGLVPGDGRQSWLDTAGRLLLLATLAAVLLHAILRVGFGLLYKGRRHG